MSLSLEKTNSMNLGDESVLGEGNYFVLQEFKGTPNQQNNKNLKNTGDLK